MLSSSRGKVWHGNFLTSFVESRIVVNERCCVLRPFFDDGDKSTRQGM
jgi:hypothetical protein